MITTYQYSKAHNRTQMVKDGVTSDYSYNNLNQLTRFTEPGRQVYFYYDDNGNRIRRIDNGVVDTYACDQGAEIKDAKFDKAGNNQHDNS